jgi:outer membrane protein assembly factor BamB
LVVLSDAGELAVVAAQPDAYRQLSRASVIEGKCWSTPAFSNGRVYVRSTHEAACVELVAQ